MEGNFTSWGRSRRAFRDRWQCDRAGRPDDSPSFLVEKGGTLVDVGEEAMEEAGELVDFCVVCWFFLSEKSDYLLVIGPGSEENSIISLLL